ncbi:MAG UNVERIFIED_CONTAM: hypothetical protein LVQ98_04870 [Rickettsiaceae bacterium]|jgi:hypothetical protein
MLKLLKEIIEDIPDSDAKKSVTNTLTPIIKNREQEQAREKATKLEALVQTAYNESTGEFNPVNLYEFLEKNPTLCGYATVIFGTKFPSAPEDIIYSIKHSVDGIKHAAPDEPHEVHTLGDGV